MEPKSSILLFDEPELHLNPRLVRDLPEFYRDYLGRPFENQVVIVTHSDAFLREAVKMEDFSIFHMQPGERSMENQVSRIQAKEELQRAVIDLVGEMADYTPSGKVVIVEGGGDVEFDREMIRALFPVFAEDVNIVSSGNKRKVQQLHDLLQRADKSQRKFFSITDRDYEDETTGVPERGRYRWDVYHIEDYLVQPGFIMQLTKDLGHTRTKFSNEDEVYGALEACAQEAVEEIVRERVEFEARKRLAACIKTGSDRGVPIGIGVEATLKGSERRLAEAVALLKKGGLAEIEAEWRGYWEESFQDGSWRGRIPGEKILRRFAGEHVGELKYERFRSLILAQMRNAGYQPEGMKKIIDAIQEAEVK